MPPVVDDTDDIDGDTDAQMSVASDRRGNSPTEEQRREEDPEYRAYQARLRRYVIQLVDSQNPISNS